MSGKNDVDKRPQADDTIPVGALSSHRASTILGIAPETTSAQDLTPDDDLPVTLVASIAPPRAGRLAAGASRHSAATLVDPNQHVADGATVVDITAAQPSSHAEVISDDRPTLCYSAEMKFYVVVSQDDARIARFFKSIQHKGDGSYYPYTTDSGSFLLRVVLVQTQAEMARSHTAVSDQVLIDAPVIIDTAALSGPSASMAPVVSAEGPADPTKLQGSLSPSQAEQVLANQGRSGQSEEATFVIEDAAGDALSFHHHVEVDIARARARDLHDPFGGAMKLPPLKNSKVVVAPQHIELPRRAEASIQAATRSSLKRSLAIGALVVFTGAAGVAIAAEVYFNLQAIFAPSHNRQK